VFKTKLLRLRDEAEWNGEFWVIIPVKFRHNTKIQNLNAGDLTSMNIYKIVPKETHSSYEIRKNLHIFHTKEQKCESLNET
jgi:hypothetical protein